MKVAMKSRKQSVVSHRQRLTYRKWHVWMRLNEASVLTADRSFGSRRIICVRSEPPGSAPPDGSSDCAVCCCNSAAGRRRVAGGGCADTAESCSPARSAACGRSPATDQRERSWHTQREPTLRSPQNCTSSHDPACIHVTFWKLHWFSKCHLPF